jgi:His-Xaa-Ser system protein HxsD
MTASDACLYFSRDAQAEAPLRHAAYRIAGTAICQLDIEDGRWLCRLSAAGQSAIGSEALKERFLAVLNDENLREQIESRTAPLRDVIVALAFGALARQ